MKKLIFLTFLYLVLISCKNNPSGNENTSNEKQPIPKSEWDSENIAYTNTNDLIIPDYIRQSGTDGIIGSFEQKISTASTSITYTYTFYDTGYYESSDKGISIHNEYINKTDTGTFQIKKSNLTNDYFWISLSSDEHGVTNYFYQVAERGLFLEPYIIVDGNRIEP